MDLCLSGREIEPELHTEPIETENVRVLGEGRYEMSVRNKGTLGSSVTTCTYDKNIGAAIR